MRLGRHMPKGVEGMRRAREIGCDAIQIFVTNPRGWQPPALNVEEDAALRAAARAEDLRPVIVHAAYIINLASPNDEIVAKSVALLRTTLDRAARVGAEGVVFHVGSAGTAGLEAGLTRLAAGIVQTLDGLDAGGGVGPGGEDGEIAPTGMPLLLLENDTGGGGKVGARFEHLAALLALLPADVRDRTGLCLDTAHLWGAGYDLGSPAGAERVLAEADALLGLDQVRVVHVNDAREGLGSHRDIHARIGEGQIPPESIAAILRAPALAHATGLLETPYPERAPGQPDWDAERELMLRARALADLPPLPPVTA